jgi:hypothetical protein
MPGSPIVRNCHRKESLPTLRSIEKYSRPASEERAFCERPYLISEFDLNAEHR